MLNLKIPFPVFAPIAISALFLGFVTLSVSARAQDDRRVDQRLRNLESEVDRLEQKVQQVEDVAGIGFIVMFLFGVVLSMWAQRRGQSGCLWFILGFLPGVNIIAALVALSKSPDSERVNRLNF